MKINNLFNALIRIKNQLKGSINDQNNSLQSLSSGFLADTSDDIATATGSVINSSKKVTLMCGEVAEIHKDAASSIYTITLSKIGDIESSSINIDISSEDFENFNFTEPLIEGFNTTMTDILHSLSEGSQVNNVILDINNLFLNKPTYTIGEILNVIKAYDYSTLGDINQIKEFLIQSSVNGEVSNYAWAQLMSKIMADSFDTIEDTGSFEVIEEKFFALQSFMSTVLTVISITFSVVVTVLGAIFKGLWIALTFVVDFVNNLFGQVFDTEFKVNASATYPGVTGTFRAGKLNKVLYTNLSDNTEISHVNNLMRIPHGCEDVYYFTQKDSNDEFATYVQSQLVLTYHPDRVMQYIRSYLLKEFKPVAGRSSTYELCIDKAFAPWNDDDTVPNYINPFLTTDEIISLTTDQTFMKRCISANICMLYFQRLIGVSRQDAIDNYMQATHSGSYPLFTFFSYDGVYHHGLAYTGANAWLAIGNVIRDLWLQNPNPDYDFTEWHYWLDEYGSQINRISGMINDFITLTNDDSTTTKTIEWSSTEYYGGLCYTNPIADIGLDGIYSISTVSGNIKNIYHNVNILDISDVDFIPTEDIVNLPSVSSSDILAAILIVVASITVATIAAKKVGSFVKSFFQKGKAKRIGRLNSLRDAYLADPTNKENAKAYRKALSNYNLKASILGWGKYDSANGWLNTDSGSGIDELNNINSLSGWESVAKLIK